MNYEEYLLITLSEELAEVQQEISKVLRFGKDNTDDRPGGKTTTNGENLEIEFQEAIAVLALIRDAGITKQAMNFAKIDKDKRERVLRYYKITKEISNAKYNLD